MTLRYGDSGPAIRVLQEKLLDRGYALPRFGSDGHLGDETWEALQRYAADQHLGWGPAVPEHVLDRLQRATSTLPDIPVSPPTPPPEHLLTSIRFYDLSKEQTNPAPKSKIIAGRMVQRAPGTINGVVIHQTACTFGVTAAQVAAAGGDEELAHARRGLKVATHMLAFRGGFAAQVNLLRSYIYNANLLNRSILGLELEGLYAGVQDDPATAPDEAARSTWGGQPQEPTEALINAGRYALGLLVERGRAEGMPIRYIYAHRQSSLNRRSDPGEQLWRAVALEYGVAVLGLVPRQHFTIGGGRPVPVEWDPQGSGHY